MRGFATNVSNYQSDDDERKYGEKLSGLLGGAHYIIDSGRNGNGSTDVWCNPPGRAYGTDPTAAPAGDSPHLDAYAWVKTARRERRGVQRRPARRPVLAGGRWRWQPPPAGERARPLQVLRAEACTRGGGGSRRC